MFKYRRQIYSVSNLILQNQKKLSQQRYIFVNPMRPFSGKLDNKADFVSDEKSLEQKIQDEIMKDESQFLPGLKNKEDKKDVK